MSSRATEGNGTEYVDWECWGEANSSIKWGCQVDLIKKLTCEHRPGGGRRGRTESWGASARGGSGAAERPRAAGGGEEPWTRAQSPSSHGCGAFVGVPELSGRPGAWLLLQRLALALF